MKHDPLVLKIPVHGGSEVGHRANSAEVTVGAPLMSSPLMSFCALNVAPISKVVVRH